MKMFSSFTANRKAPIPVMFIVGKGSKHDNVELRCALRSLAKFGRGISRVIVAGNPPDWLAPDVERIEIEPVPLAGRNRQITWNVIDGVRRAKIRGDFILAMDDVILLRETDFPTLPNWCSAYSLPFVPPTNGSWGQAMTDTGRWLQAHGYTALNFMIHAHVRMNAETILKHFDELKSTAFTDETVRGLEVLSLVGNMSISDGIRDHGSGIRDLVVPCLHADVKLANFDLTGVRDFFSYSDRIFEDPKFINYLAYACGGKCAYEADDPQSIDRLVNIST